MTKFIDLQRRFRELTQEELEDPEFLAYLNDAEFGSALGWAELLTMNRVLLLAEAGSGKTREMSEQAKRLTAEGKYAFFVAMETLDQETLVGLLSVDEERSFNVWKTDGRSPAWFFLDAVDELKLTGGKLDRALQRFSKAINGHLGRARVIVSCRPSDWRPITDMATVRDKVPMPQQPSQTPEPDEFFLKVLQQERSKPDESKENESENADGVRTVILLPLSTRQIKRFAARSDVHDTSAFMAELHRQNAWTFARRPLDLSELIATWTSTGQLGTRAKQHDANLTAKLKDAPDRPDNGVLSDDRARLGAERLALALALTRTRTIKSPDQTLATERAEGILDAALILKDWTEEERQTLLRRALFDPATYGRVRFHHRSVQEYLAACHLKALRNKGMSTKALFRLLFAERYGEKVVIPSMRPIAAWLALWDDSVRRELTRREPEVLLSAGDPGSLTIAARAELLRAFVAAYGEGSWRGLHIPIDEVHRLADPELGPTIRELWGSGPSNADVRELLINVIWQGPVEACSDLAKEAALDTTWDRYHRVAAVRALLACGHEKAVREIAQGLLNKAIDWPDECVPALAEDLFPKIITVDELILLMERTPEPKGTVGGFGWVGRQIVKVIEPLSNVAVELRDKLAELIWRGRKDKQKFYRIRGRFNHLAPALALLCNRQLETLSLKIDAHFIRASVIASRLAGGDTGTREPVGKLRMHFRDISELRAAAFWMDLGLMDELVLNANEWQRVYLASHDGLIGSIVEGDRAWLEAALADETSPERRPVALFPLLDIWNQRGRIAAEANSLRRQLKGDKALETIFANGTAPRERDANVKKVERTAEQQRKKAAAREALRFQDWTKWRLKLLASPAQAFSPEKRLDTISRLYSWLAASAPSRNRYDVWNRQALEQAFGTDVVQQAAAAFQVHWRQTQPVLWSARPAGQQNSTPYSWVYGLCGVASEAALPNWTSHLTADEARTATAYATVELNGFAPFLGDLVSVFPAEVEAVLGGELIAELDVGADHDHLSILQDLARADGSVKQLLTPRLSAALTEWPTTSSGEAATHRAGHLVRVLGILDETSAEPERTALADECARRYKLDTSGPLALVWLRGLFKFDPERGAETLSATLVASNDAATRSREVETFASLFGEHDAVALEISDPAVRSSSAIPCAPVLGAKRLCLHSARRRRGSRWCVHAGHARLCREGAQFSFVRTARHTRSRSPSGNP